MRNLGLDANLAREVILEKRLIRHIPVLLLAFFFSRHWCVDSMIRDLSRLTWFQPAAEISPRASSFLRQIFLLSAAPNHCSLEVCASIRFQQSIVHNLFLV